MLAKLTPNTQIIGQNLIYFNQIDSSNDFAQRLIQEKKAINGTLIITAYQSKGRGQGQHIWESQAGKNLLCSLILLPESNIQDAFVLNKALAISLVETLQPLIGGNKINIKWPNDLFVGRRKLGGLLVENTFQGQSIKSAVMGFGINTFQSFEDSTINAIQLEAISQEAFSHETIILHWVKTFESYYNNILKGQSKGIHEQFNTLLLGYEQTSTFEINGQSLSATIKGCDEHGRLILESNQGQQNLYLHGQITQVINE